MKNNTSRTIKIFWTIVGMTFICLILNMPSSLPIKINLGRIKWEHTFYRPELNFKLGSISLKKNIDLKYGLDLAGGASLIFDIDTTKIKKEEIASALESSCQ